MIEEGEEEVECDHENADLNTKESTPKKDAHQDCITELCDMDDEEILNAKTFILKDSSNGTDWDILPYGEHLKCDDIKCKGETLKNGIELSYNTFLNAIFFDDGFPCIKGHAK